VSNVCTQGAKNDCATLAEADMQRMNEAVVAKGGYVARLNSTIS